MCLFAWERRVWRRSISFVRESISLFMASIVCLSSMLKKSDFFSLLSRVLSLSRLLWRVSFIAAMSANMCVRCAFLPLRLSVASMCSRCFILFVSDRMSLIRVSRESRSLRASASSCREASIRDFGCPASGFEHAALRSESMAIVMYRGRFILICFLSSSTCKFTKKSGMCVWERCVEEYLSIYGANVSIKMW